MADGLRAFAFPDRALKPSSGVFAAGFSGQGQTPFAEVLLKKRILKFCDVTNCQDAEPVQLLFRHFAYSGNVAYLERGQELRLLAWNYIKDAVRLGFPRADFRDQARAADSDGAVEPGFLLHSLMKLMGGEHRWTVQALRPCHIQIGFVDRNHLDLRRERFQHAVDFLRAIAIAVGM